MNRSFPSMTALLGLLAIAGYQNRDKLAELMRGQGVGGRTAEGGPGSLGGLLGGAGAAGAGGLGGLLSRGLGELVERFKNNGQGEAAESWVSRGPNKELAPPDLERAIGSDVLDELTRHTGLSRPEIVARLSRELPQAVDKYTPEGRIPTAADLDRT